MTAASDPDRPQAATDSALLGLAVVDTLMATRQLLDPVRSPDANAVEVIDERLVASFAAGDVARVARAVLPASLTDFLD